MAALQLRFQLCKLFIAGIVPGLLAIAMHIVTIAIIGVVRPGFLPAWPRSSWKESFIAIRDVWSPLLLFLFVTGSMAASSFRRSPARSVFPMIATWLPQRMIGGSANLVAHTTTAVILRREGDTQDAPAPRTDRPSIEGC